MKDIVIQVNKDNIFKVLEELERNGVNGVVLQETFIHRETKYITAKNNTVFFGNAVNSHSITAEEYLDLSKNTLNKLEKEREVTTWSDKEYRKPMTLNEVENELGYKINLVNEKED